MSGRAALDPLLALGGLEGAAVELVGADPVLATRFRAGEAAAAALGAVGAAAGELWRERSGQLPSVSVDVRAAAATLLSSFLNTIDGKSPLLGREISHTTGLYPARDGRWIHLHGGFPALRDGTLRVLGCEDARDALAQAVAAWDAFALEDALAAERLCGCAVRTEREWAEHPQGAALAKVPPVEVVRLGASAPEPFAPAPRPLAGVRVLDLTRVLAGPTSARTLAEHGADVLHVRGPALPSIEPFVIDTNAGKRSCYVDLDTADGRDTLRALARDADVFSQGYRGGALAGRGLGPEELARLRPGIVYVSINCYGHEGPWRDRPGWEQLAQSATGIAHEQGGAERPQLLPAAATDYTTGYLAAYGALLALLRRAREGGSYHVRVSHARTGQWLQSLGRVPPDVPLPTRPDPALLAPWFTMMTTEWGELRRLGPVTRMPEVPPRWERPVVPLGTDPASW